MLGVGCSTIREAVNGLAMLGAVEIRHGQGAFVANAAAGLEAPDAIAVALARGVTRDLFEARLIIEVETARLAAARRTETDLREIEQALVDHAARDRRRRAPRSSRRSASTRRSRRRPTARCSPAASPRSARC